VSPWGNSGVSATTFKIATGIYLIVVAMLASTIGGYIAGRLRTKWTGLHSEQVLFRDANVCDPAHTTAPGPPVPCGLTAAWARGFR